jgi:hypothetical protein
MHFETITIEVFDVGDFVRTPRGVGIITAVEEDLKEVIVKHKYGDSDNPSNLPKIMEDYIPILITKEEYDNER